MKKVAFSILILLVISIFSYGLFYYFNRSTKPTTSKSITDSTNVFRQVTTTEASKNIQQSNELKVTLASPKQAITVLNEDSIKLAGATRRNTVVSVIGGKTPILRKVDSDGSFAPDIQLNEGSNILTITVYDDNGAQSTVKRTVLYLKDNLPSEYGSAEGRLSTSTDKSVTIEEASQPVEYAITKQTKMYEISTKGKTLLRSTASLTTAAHTYLFYDNSTDKNALIVLQDLSEPIPSKISYSVVTDKEVTAEQFIIHAQTIKSPVEKIDFNITASSIIYKENDLETVYRGSDIKIGDHILVSEKPTKVENEFVVETLIIIPGQAAGVLKDVKAN